MIIAGLRSVVTQKLHYLNVIFCGDMAFLGLQQKKYKQNLHNIILSCYPFQKYFYSIELGEVHGKHCQGKPKRVSTGAIPEFRTQRDS